MFPEKLKQLRQTHNLSQSDLANQLHVVRQTISKWEQGLSVPDADMLVQLSHLFQISVNELLGCEANPASIPSSPDPDPLSAMVLEQSRRSKRTRRMVAALLIAILLLILLALVLSLAAFQQISQSTEDIEQIARMIKIALPNGKPYHIFWF